MTAVRCGELKINFERLTDAELDNVIEKVQRRVHQEQSFLRLALAKREQRAARGAGALPAQAVEEAPRGVRGHRDRRAAPAPRQELVWSGVEGPGSRWSSG
jgi:hypothetical protein